MADPSYRRLLRIAREDQLTALTRVVAAERGDQATIDAAQADAAAAARLVKWLEDHRHA